MNRTSAPCLDVPAPSAPTRRCLVEGCGRHHDPHHRKRQRRPCRACAGIPAGSRGVRGVCPGGGGAAAVDYSAGESFGLLGQRRRGDGALAAGDARYTS
eukprot:1184179-Prorocentrum_minimum.AAC.15